MIADPMFRSEGSLFPSTSRSHVAFIMYVPEALSGIRVAFSYSPKLLMDQDKIRELSMEAAKRFRLYDRTIEETALSNLLTLSFDDENGFRGCAHRHSNDQELVLAESEASPGLLPGPIPRGEFRVTLSAHAVLSETCEYSLSIFADAPI